MHSLRRAVARAHASALPRTAFKLKHARALGTNTPIALILGESRRQVQSRKPLAVKNQVQQRWASDDAATTASGRPTSTEKVTEVIEEVTTSTTKSAETTPQSSTDATSPASSSSAELSTSSTTAAADVIEGAASQASSPAQKPEGTLRTLWIGNLPYKLGIEELKETVDAIVPSTYARLMKDTYGRSKGFAYFDFETHEDAQAVKRALINREIHGRRAIVNFSRGAQALPKENDERPRVLNPPSKVIFIGNIPYDASDKDLNQLFRPVNNAVEFRVAIDRQTGHPRGYCHAEFIDTPSAQKAFEYFSGKSIHGRQLRIDYSHEKGRMQRHTIATQTHEAGAPDSSAE